MKKRKPKYTYTFFCWSCKKEMTIFKIKNKEVSINGMLHAICRCPECKKNQRRKIITIKKEE